MKLRSVDYLIGVSVSKVVCGKNHVLALTEDHQVFAWGNGKYGKLGLNSEESQYWPSKVTLPISLNDINQISVGTDSSFIITKSGVASACGNNK